MIIGGFHWETLNVNSDIYIFITTPPNYITCNRYYAGKLYDSTRYYCFSDEVTCYIPCMPDGTRYSGDLWYQLKVNGDTVFPSYSWVCVDHASDSYLNSYTYIDENSTFHSGDIVDAYFSDYDKSILNVYYFIDDLEKPEWTDCYLGSEKPNFNTSDINKKFEDNYDEIYNYLYSKYKVKNADIYCRVMLADTLNYDSREIWDTNTYYLWTYGNYNNFLIEDDQDFIYELNNVVNLVVIFGTDNSWPSE